MKIHHLADQVVNQIAAGEVVERPAAVVRELVENSLDAGAADVRVELIHGGYTAIRVIDDGEGMERDDALLSLERHATSKISSEHDLEKITSFGFRGEALPSIAAVSRFSLCTRTRTGELATRIEVNGGSIREVTSCSAPCGTEIEVRQLFYNAPVRRKFRRAPRTEELRVKQWLQGISLAAPQVRIRLFCDDREVLNLPRAASLVARARSFLRGAAQEVRYTLERDGVRYEVSGLVAHPGEASGAAGACCLLVNRRVVLDKALQRAVRDGFLSTLKDREFPLGFISLEVPPDAVDVNVHPQKSEVRFVHPGAAFEAVRDAVSEAVRGFRSPQAAAPVANVSGAAYAATLREPLPEYSPQPAYRQGGLFGGDPPFPVADGPSGSDAETFRFSDLRYIGQALGCYLIGECAAELVVVDMHAAHERYNYNLIRNALGSPARAVQELLLPLEVPLSEQEIERVSSQLELLAGFGFSLQPVAEGVRITAVPAVFAGADLPAVVRELAAIEDGFAQPLGEFLDHLAARTACHASVRGGDLLKREEALALLGALDRTEFSAACPHGRPVVVRFSSAQVERWFGRDR